MNRPYVPQPILDAAHARSAARAAGLWKEADRLREDIEAAGWRIVDSGTNFRLEPAEPPDTIEDDVVRYGRSGAVPSRTEEPSTARATIVVVATDAPGAIERTLGGLLAHRGADDQVLLICDGPAPELEVHLSVLPADVEVIRTAERLGAGAALNIGLRRAVGAIVVLLDAAVEPTGDIVDRLASALNDPAIAVVGYRGRRTADLRRYEAVSLVGEATSITGDVLAFRRADGRAAMPVDEGFSSALHLDTWWSLMLRAGADDRDDEMPRRAVVVPDVPVVVHVRPSVSVGTNQLGVREGKRNFYRLLGRFRDRADLLSSAGLP